MGFDCGWGASLQAHAERQTLGRASVKAEAAVHPSACPIRLSSASTLVVAQPLSAPAAPLPLDFGESSGSRGEGVDHLADSCGGGGATRAAGIAAGRGKLSARPSFGSGATKARRARKVGKVPDSIRCRQYAATRTTIDSSGKAWLQRFDGGGAVGIRSLRRAVEPWGYGHWKQREGLAAASQTAVEPWGYGHWKQREGLAAACHRTTAVVVTLAGSAALMVESRASPDDGSRAATQKRLWGLLHRCRCRSFWGFTLLQS